MSKHLQVESGSAAGFRDKYIRRISALSKESISRWISKTAEERQVVLKTTRVYRFAANVSRLSDGVEWLDESEQTLIALSRRGVLTPYQRGMLQIGYLKNGKKNS